MKIKFPLYARILLWFFLNVVILGVVFFILAGFQFRFGLDFLINGPAGEHLDTVTRLLREDLRDSNRAEWDATLKRFGEINHVQFYLFRPDAFQVAGDPITLPPQVRARLGGPQGLGPPGGRRGDQPAPPGDEGPPGSGQPPPRRAPPQKIMVHTFSPSQYWVIIHSPPEPDQPRPMPILLVGSDSLSAGGLFFDLRPWLLAGVGVVVISALFWFPLVRGITRSIAQMTLATERIAEGQFDVRTEVHRKDELGLLSDAINRMAVRLSGLVTGQKRFLGDIAHELCSPISRIQVSLGILEHQADDRQKARLDDLREEIEQMSNLVNELLSFSRASLGKPNLNLQPVSLRALAEKAAARECGSGAAPNIKIEVPENLQAVGEPDLLVRALGNVLRNSIRYAGHAGPIVISAGPKDHGVCLMVEDSGPGIPEAALPHVFDPFYRVDPSRTRDTGGVGLGLSIVKTCVESCGGTVACENRQPNGCRITIGLKSNREGHSA